MSHIVKTFWLSFENVFGIITSITWSETALQMSSFIWLKIFFEKKSNCQKLFWGPIYISIAQNFNKFIGFTRVFGASESFLNQLKLFDSKFWTFNSLRRNTIHKAFFRFMQAKVICSLCVLDVFSFGNNLTC